MGQQHDDGRARRGFRSHHAGRKAEDVVADAAASIGPACAPGILKTLSSKPVCQSSRVPLVRMAREDMVQVDLAQPLGSKSRGELARGGHLQPLRNPLVPGVTGAGVTYRRPPMSSQRLPSPGMRRTSSHVVGVSVCMVDPSCLPASGCANLISLSLFPPMSTTATSLELHGFRSRIVLGRGPEPRLVRSRGPATHSAWSPWMDQRERPARMHRRSNAVGVCPRTPRGTRKHHQETGPP